MFWICMINQSLYLSLDTKQLFMWRATQINFHSQRICTSAKKDITYMSDNPKSTPTVTVKWGKPLHQDEHIINFMFFNALPVMQLAFIPSISRNVLGHAIFCHMFSIDILLLHLCLRDWCIMYKGLDIAFYAHVFAGVKLLCGHVKWHSYPTNLKWCWPRRHMCLQKCQWQPSSHFPSLRSVKLLWTLQ